MVIIIIASSGFRLLHDVVTATMPVRMCVTQEHLPRTPWQLAHWRLHFREPDGFRDFCHGGGAVGGVQAEVAAEQVLGYWCSWAPAAQVTAGRPGRSTAKHRWRRLGIPSHFLGYGRCRLSVDRDRWPSFAGFDPEDRG